MMTRFLAFTGLLIAALMMLAMPLRAAELIMVEEQGCVWCARWNAEIAPIYPKTAESVRAPLRRIDIGEQDGSGIRFARPVMFTPTFVLIDNDQEVGRIEGYPGEDFFWGYLTRLLNQMPEPTSEDKS